MTHAYAFGIEEEYFLSHTRTRDACEVGPRRFHEAAKRALPRAVQPEMFQSQLEVATEPSSDMGDVLRTLSSYRSLLGAMGLDHGVLVHACGTHPLAIWARQKATGQARYGQLMHDLQMLGARNMVCGLHVHVCVPDPARRVDLMVRMIPYLPLFLALSTSSPFWQARRTGLMGYRLAAYDELPRTGLPDLFEDAADYQSYIDTLIASRAIADSTHIWWAIRPSLKHPTLELRVADSCTRVEDVIGLAALYRALVRHLDRNPSLNAGMKASHRALALENKWRAQRYGIHGSFVDAERRALVSVPEALNEVLDMLDADLVALDCRREAHNLKEIFERGTSADGQIALFTDARGRGVSHGRALAEVVDWLATTTSGVQMEQLRPRLH